MANKKILIPAYFYPGVEWNQLISLASTYGSKLRAIANPNSGPGISYDSNYYDTLHAFTLAGGYGYGYIHTSYGTRNINDVKADIDNWYNWYNIYGFFVDEMDNVTGHEAYYQEIYNYIKGLWSGFLVIGNPGTTTIESYLYYLGNRVVDVLCCFEGSSDYSSWYNSSWTNGYSADNFCSLCYGCTSKVTALNYLDHALNEANSEYFYATDDVLPNPWDTLPTWDVEELLKDQVPVIEEPDTWDRKVIIKKNEYGVGLYGIGYYGSGSDIIIDDKWKYKYIINDKSSLTCTVTKYDSIPQKGHQFELYLGTKLEFAGVISRVLSYEDTPNYLNHNLTIQDFTLLCDKRRVGQSFSNKTASYIINWVIDNILYQEGVSAGTIEEGMTFDRVYFNYKTCTEVFNYIVDACPGYNWNIDKYKKIHFRSKYSNKCTTKIDSNLVHYKFMPDRSLDKYINTLYLEGGKKQTVEFTEYIPTPKPDGNSKTFVLPYGLALQPTIEVKIGAGAWTIQTVGISQFDTDKQWYWMYGVDKIEQDYSQSVLTDSDQIRVTFTGLTNVRMVITDDDKINEMQNTDGGTGIYEGVYVDNSIASNKQGYNVGTSIIEKYSQLDFITFQVINENLGDMDINKLVYVNKPLFNILNWFLIESITASSFNPETVTYELKILFGDTLGSWEKHFKSLLNQSKDINLDDVFVQVKLLKETIDYGGVLKVRSTQNLKCSTNLKTSNTLLMGSLQGSEDIYD